MANVQTTTTTARSRLVHLQLEVVESHRDHIDTLTVWHLRVLNLLGNNEEREYVTVSDLVDSVRGVRQCHMLRSTF